MHNALNLKELWKEYTRPKNKYDANILLRQSKRLG
jgi:hypothetical protein